MKIVVLSAICLGVVFLVANNAIANTEKNLAISPTDQAVLLKLDSAFEAQGYFPIDPYHLGNVPPSGADQIFLHQSLDRLVFVKLHHDVASDSGAPIYEDFGGEGAFAHATIGKIPVTLLFYFSSPGEAKRIFHEVMKIPFRHARGTIDSLIPQAHAEEVCSFGATAFDTLLEGLEGTALVKKSLGGQSIKALSPCLVSALRSAASAFAAPLDLALGVWNAVTSPQETWNKIKTQAVRLKQFVTHFGENVIGLWANLRSLPGDVLLSIGCQALATIVGPVLLSALVGGANIATVLLNVTNWFSKITRLSSLVSQLAKLGASGKSMLFGLLKRMDRIPEDVLEKMATIGRTHPRLATELAGLAECAI